MEVTLFFMFGLMVLSMIGFMAATALKSISFRLLFSLLSICSGFFLTIFGILDGHTGIDIVLTMLVTIIYCAFTGMALSDACKTND